MVGIRVARGGAVDIALRVPFAERDEAWTLAGATGLMLACDIRRKRYK